MTPNIPFNKPFIAGKELYYIAQAVTLGYWTECGSALMNELKVGSVARALAPETVAGRSSYSRSNCSWGAVSRLWRYRRR